MNTSHIDFYDILEKGDVYELIDSVEDCKDAIWDAWNAQPRESMEPVLKLAVQETEGVKNRKPELRISSAYHMGRLDGYTEAFEKLFRAEQGLRAAERELPAPSPKALQIMQVLYEKGNMRHGELADAVGSSYSALTNMMKKLLLSGAVASTRSGRNTHYHLTEIGRSYFQRGQEQEDSVRVLKEAIRSAVAEGVRTALSQKTGDPAERGDADGGANAQCLRVSDRIVPYINHERQEPLAIERILKDGPTYYVEFVTDMTNMEDEAVLPLYFGAQVG